MNTSTNTLRKSRTTKDPMKNLRKITRSSGEYEEDDSQRKTGTQSRMKIQRMSLKKRKTMQIRITKDVSTAKRRLPQ